LANIPRPLRTCLLCMNPVPGQQVVKCVGLGVVLKYFGLSNEQVSSTLMGDPEHEAFEAEGSVNDLDLRIWCIDCGQKVLEGRRTPAPTGDDSCELCPKGEGYFWPRGVLKHGCTIMIPSKGGDRFLCSNCTEHIKRREERR